MENEEQRGQDDKPRMDSTGDAAAVFTFWRTQGKRAEDVPLEWREPYVAWLRKQAMPPF
ncbi:MULTISPECIES: hypothetical protein [Ramlibacter]|uniref:Uncharacterized protein n=1 Tax=Ramlibacter pinisoli TaxID=2682844 RepID=A0A6N8IZQ6_9BURK|nr:MULTISPECIES: hypothetical protein [Ramlibacter]MBA2962142.1 hypothetical protein [Ramlibacter sp. CGMCC 1.13660]MVQ32085.1 hypothetical protein [Ramlibacter pinisoli]